MKTSITIVVCKRKEKKSNLGKFLVHNCFFAMAINISQCVNISSVSLVTCFFFFVVDR
jgi:hypothetical protein